MPLDRPLQNGEVTPAKLSGGQTGNAPAYACRAWVNFNGGGTPAINAAGNVSSITDNGLGDYTINFTTALPDANYCACLGAGISGNSDSDAWEYNTISHTSTAFRVLTGSSSTGALADATVVYAAFFR